MSSRRDLARALFLREIGSLRRLRIIKHKVDVEFAMQMLLLGATVDITRDLHHVYFAEDGGLPRLFEVGASTEAVL